MVDRVHQKPQRHFEHLVDFVGVGVQLEARPHPRHRGKDAKSKTGGIEIEIPDRGDEGAMQTDLLLRLAQRGVERRRIGRIDLAAGKRYLPGVIIEMSGALGQQHRRLLVLDLSLIHRGGCIRDSFRDDPQHVIGALVAARRDDAGVAQPRGDVEAQAGPGTIEEFRRRDVGGGVALQ